MHIKSPGCKMGIGTPDRFHDISPRQGPVAIAEHQIGKFELFCGQRNFLLAMPDRLLDTIKQIITIFGRRLHC